jgi:hypothetical protein
MSSFYQSWFIGQVIHDILYISRVLLCVDVEMFVLMFWFLFCVSARSFNHKKQVLDAALLISATSRQNRG